MKKNNQGFSNPYEIIVIVLFVSVLFIAGMYAWQNYSVISSQSQSKQIDAACYNLCINGPELFSDNYPDFKLNSSYSREANCAAYCKASVFKL